MDSRVSGFKSGVCTLRVEVNLQRGSTFLHIEWGLPITQIVLFNFLKGIGLSLMPMEKVKMSGESLSCYLGSWDFPLVFNFSSLNLHITRFFYRGIGVIGEQPVILPRTGFEYSSACPLSTPSGRMVKWEDFVPASILINLRIISFAN